MVWTFHGELFLRLMVLKFANAELSFGDLILHGTMRVGKDRHSWQDLECYLFTEMLICVKARKSAQSQAWNGVDSAQPRSARCTLKGSILIRKHLKHVEALPGG